MTIQHSTFATMLAIDLVRFSDLLEEWSPTLNVHRYLTSNSRSRDSSGRFSSWLSLMAHRWNGSTGAYSPTFFWGVRRTDDVDVGGFRIYRYGTDRDG